jgi:uncharacterized protein (UPF0216 family)
MSVDPSYEKQVSEIQTLKKALGNEKVAHQSTVDQLHASYTLNTELQTVIRSQSATIDQLNQRLGERTAKLSEMAVSYEQRLAELKQFVSAKERELQTMRGSLVVTDYDMVRLRVISELETGHREQMEERNAEVERLSKLWAHEKQ